MKISEVLKPECMIATLKSSTQEEVIRELSSIIHQAHPELSEKELAQVLLEREKLGSTGIGSGVAIPHGKLPGLKKIVAAFGRSPEGIDFDAQDSQKVHLFFALFVPENAAGLHLKALAKLSRLLKDASFREKILSLSDCQNIHQLIIDAEKQDS